VLNFILVVGLITLAAAVTLIVRGLGARSGGTSETVEQIGAYGFAGTYGSTVAQDEPVSVGQRLDNVASRVGGTIGRHFERIDEDKIRTRLIAAGMYTTSPGRVIGYQALLAAGAVFLWLWLGALGGFNPLLVVVGAIVIGFSGWVLPLAYVDNRAQDRREKIERELPDLIDLLIVSLEAGMSFGQSMRLSAQRLKGPLAQEVRLTLQEQNMGLTLVESLRNLQVRAETPGMRIFVRAVSQGETLGVSIGQIMRNVAEEMRKRRKAAAEERAQKAPVKMLFPLIFLIFPAIFVVLLLPSMIRIMDVL
jgi:tight adherence protein C